MIYSYDLTIPQNTQAASPASVKMPLTSGIITKVEVLPAPGCNNAVFCCIRQAIHQVWPTNADGAFRLGVTPISYTVHYPLLTEPYELQAYGWSPGTTYPHIVTIRLGITLPEVLNPPRPADTIIARLGALILGPRS